MRNPEIRLEEYKERTTRAVEYLGGFVEAVGDESPVYVFGSLARKLSACPSDINTIRGYFDYAADMPRYRPRSGNETGDWDFDLGLVGNKQDWQRWVDVRNGLECGQDIWIDLHLLDMVDGDAVSKFRPNFDGMNTDRALISFNSIRRFVVSDNTAPLLAIDWEVDLRYMLDRGKLRWKDIAGWMDIGGLRVENGLPIRFDGWESCVWSYLSDPKRSLKDAVTLAYRAIVPDNWRKKIKQTKENMNSNNESHPLAESPVKYF